MASQWDKYTGGATEAPKRNAIAAGLSSGLDDLQGLGYSGIAAVADTVGADTFKDWANEQAARNEWESQKNGRADLDRIEDVYDKPSQWLPYLGYQVGKQVPNIVGGIAAGMVVPQAVVPAALARGLAYAPKFLGGGALGAAEGFAAKKAALATGQTVADQLVGGAAWNYGQSVGSLYQAAQEGGDMENAGPKSLLGGVPYSLLETAPTAMLVGRLGAGHAFNGGLGMRVAKASGVQAGLGATSEIGQTAMENAYNGNLTPEQEQSNYLNAGVAGGLVEGVLGSFGGVRSRKAPAVAPTIESGGQGNLLQVGLDPSVRSPNEMVSFPDGSTMTRAEYQATFGDRPDSGGPGPSSPVNMQRQDMLKAAVASGEITFEQAKQMGYVEAVNQPFQNAARAGAGLDTQPLVDQTSGVTAPPTQVSPADIAAARLEPTGLMIPRLALGQVETPETTHERQLRAAGLPDQADEAAMDHPDYQAVQKQQEQAKAQAAQAEGRRQATEFGDRMKAKGLNPVDKDQASFFRQLAAAVEQGVIPADRADELVGQVLSSTPIAPQAIVDSIIKPAVKAANDTKKAAEQDARKGKIVADSAALESRAGVISLEGLDSVLEALNTSHQAGQTALGLARKAETARKAQAAKDAAQAVKDAADAAKLKAAEAAMPPKATIKPTKPANVINAEAPKVDTSPAPIVQAAAVPPAAGPVVGETATVPPAAPAESVVSDAGPGAVKKPKVFTRAADKPVEPKPAELAPTIDEQIAAARKVIADKKTATAKANEGIIQLNSGIPIPDGFLELLPDYIKLAVLYLKKAGNTFAGYVQHMLETDPDLTDAQLRKIHTAAARDVKNNRVDIGGDKNLPGNPQLVTFGSRADGTETLMAKMAGKAGYAQAEKVDGQWVLKSAGAADRPLGASREEALNNLPYEFFTAKNDSGSPAAEKTKSGAKNVAFKAEGSAVLGGQLDLEMLDAAAGHHPKMLKAIRYYLGVDDEGLRTLGRMSQTTALKKAGMESGSQGNFSKAMKDLGITDEVQARFEQGSATDEVGDADNPEANRFIDDSETADKEGTAVGLQDEVDKEQYKGIDDFDPDAPKRRSASSVGGSVGDIAATKKGELRDQNWYTRALGAAKSIKDVPTRTLAKLAFEGKDYLDDKNRRVLGLIMGAVRQKSLSDPAGTAKILREMEKEYDESDYKGYATKRNAEEAERAAKAVSSKSRSKSKSGARPDGRTDTEYDYSESDENDDTEDEVSYSKGQTSGETHTAKSLTDSLKDYVRADALGRNVVVVESAADLSDVRDLVAYNTKDAVAWARDGKAYLVADRIAKGDERAVFLHEVGVHLGLERMLTPESFKRLTGKLQEWADKNDDSVESKLSKKALARVDAAGTDKKDRASEHLAYFVEEAVKAGIDPAVAKYNSPIARWLRDLYAAFKTAVRKLGMNPDKLTAQDVVNLAYGAARLEVQKGLPVATNPGADSSRVKFSKATTSAATAENNRYEQAAERISKSLAPAAKAGFANVTDFWQKNAPRFLTNHQLVEQHGVALRSLPTYVGVQQRMTQETNEQSAVFHDLLIKWDAFKKKSPALNTAMEAIMKKATMTQIHPDLAFNDALNAHLDPTKLGEYNTLAAQYKVMTPEAKAIYQATKETLVGDWNKRREAYGTLVDYMHSVRLNAAEGDPAMKAQLDAERDETLNDYDKKINDLKGPYFPLARFGEYLAIGKSAKLQELQQKVKDATGKERTEMTKQINTLKKDKAHYIVSLHETKGQQNSALAAIKAAGLTPEATLANQYIAGSMGNASQATLANFMNVVDSQFDKETAGQLNSAITAMMLQSLPEMHALRREAARQGIEGATDDMQRAVAAAGQKGSYYNARMAHASELTDALRIMKAESRGDIKLEHIFREMEQRAFLDMAKHETPLQDALSSMSWLYHLGVSPSFLLINSTQPWLVTGPVLAGKYGFGAATRALGGATKDALLILKEARFKDGKFDAWSGIDKDNKGLDGKPYLNTDERTMLRNLMKRGIVSEGAQNDSALFAEGTNDWRTKVARNMGFMTQQIEIANRVATALAAYRLAKADPKIQTDAEAVEYAYNTTVNTQFDYSSEGTARIMREGGGVPLAKLVFQFRRYQQSMMYVLGTNIKRAIQNKAERKEALATLAYFAMSSGMAAGTMGLPFMSLALFLVNLGIDDDDPEGKAEVRLRNMLKQMTGDSKTADVLAKGLPALFGADLSQRIGLGDVASPFPMLKMRGRTGQENMGELALSALGPVGGLAAQMFDGMTRISQGDLVKGIEKLSPKFIADLSKGTRYGFGDGLTDGKGTPTGADINGWNAFEKMLGITSTTESNYFEGTNAIKGVESAVKQREGRIGGKYQEALRDGDMAPVRSMIDKFNEDHPEHRITFKNEMEWRKAARESGQNRNAAGVKMGVKKNAVYNQLADFTN